VSRDAASRDAFAEAVSAVSSSCFVPLAAGGWITDEAYAAKLLLSGADKMVVNTALADNPAWVNQSPYEKGWMIKLKAKNAAAELGQLLDASAYGALLEEAHS